MADKELNNAIENAAKEIEAKTVPVETEEPETEIESPETESPEGEEKPPDSGELTEAQIEESKNLYKALSGPQARAIIAAMAEQAGILPKHGEPSLTKTEQISAKRDVQTIVKEALGPEYAFLSERIGKIFDEVSAAQRAETQGQLAELHQANIEREVVSAYERLATDTKGESKKFESRMAQLSEEIPIGNMNVKTYMQRLYAVASQERKSSPQKVADQIRKNANDVPARLKTTSVQEMDGVEIPSKKMNINEAVNWAASQLTKGKR